MRACDPYPIPMLKTDVVQASVMNVLWFVRCRLHAMSSWRFPLGRLGITTPCLLGATKNNYLTGKTTKSNYRSSKYTTNNPQGTIGPIRKE